MIVFPSHYVVMLTDQDSYLLNCFPCNIDWDLTWIVHKPLGSAIQVGLDGIMVPTSNVVKPIGDDYPAEVAREADLDVPVREAHVS